MTNLLRLQERLGSSQLLQQCYGEPGLLVFVSLGYSTINRDARVQQAGGWVENQSVMLPDQSDQDN